MEIPVYPFSHTGKVEIVFVHIRVVLPLLIFLPLRKNLNIVLSPVRHKDALTPD